MISRLHCFVVACGLAMSPPPCASSAYSSRRWASAAEVGQGPDFGMRLIGNARISIHAM